MWKPESNQRKKEIPGCFRIQRQQKNNMADTYEIMGKFR